MSKQKPNIFKFDDYRKYLRECIEFRKASGESSLRSVSFKAGFRSSNYLSLVINKKRGLTPASIDKVARALALNIPETEFFHHLVMFNQAKTAAERTKHRDHLMKSRAYVKTAPLKSKTVNYYSNWYYIAIRELVALADFREDSNWIAMRLRNAITPNDAEKALKDLIELGMLERGTDGKLRQVEKTVAPDDSITSSSLVDFHLNMIEKSKHALENMPSTERDVSAVTIPVNNETSLKMRLLITEFRRALLRLSEECEQTDQVVQVNFQYFPLTLKAAGGDE